MVGQTVAVFCALEIKDKGKATVLQRHFISVVNEAGGVAGVARSVEEAQRIVGM